MITDSVTPTDAQAAVIKKIIAWYESSSGPREFYLAGYAGVGKSTLANVAINELRAKHEKLRVKTGTFTGKAAHVLRTKGVSNAQTIHSLIYTAYENDKGELQFSLDPEAPARNADLIVLDEVSMVNDELANDLRSFGKKLLVIGDPGQLPPISGAGAFTRREPDALLTEIHRQALDSPILQLATLAREGQPLPLGSWTDSFGNVTRVVEHDEANQSFIYDETTQVICGVHAVRFGYTRRLREQRGFGGPVPMVGETLLCCRNDAKLGLFNGAFARLDKIGPGGANLRLDVTLDHDKVQLTRLKTTPIHFARHRQPSLPLPRAKQGVQEFDWGYVLTCHKSQGSEWPEVTVIDDSSSFRSDRHRWRYTAITRASERLTFLSRT